MGRLIDADILIAELKESALHHCNNPREDSLLQRDRVIVRAQPTVEAIPKADYENRLKADMVAMLEELKEQLREMHEDFFETEHFDEAYGVSDSMDVIQEKINELKGDQEGEE
jgi:hypothetical protein